MAEELNEKQISTVAEVNLHCKILACQQDYPQYYHQKMNNEGLVDVVWETVRDMGQVVIERYGDYYRIGSQNIYTLYKLRR